MAEQAVAPDALCDCGHPYDLHRTLGGPCLCSVPGVDEWQCDCWQFSTGGSDPFPNPAAAQTKPEAAA